VLFRSKAGDTALGAGAGSGVGHFAPGAANLASGNSRVFAVFNPLPEERTACCLLTIWDIPSQTLPLMAFYDESGAPPLKARRFNNKYRVHYRVPRR
jgi:hypothetical protein